MSIKQKLTHEIKALAVATLYFATWIGALLVLKTLILAEYDIAFHHFSMALIGALVLSKVVLILEHVPLGADARQPAWMDVVLRTVLYSIGVAVVLMLERGIEGRHEHGGFGPAVAAALKGANAAHVWANVICVSGALLTYNALSVVRRHVGEGGLLRMFRSPLPAASPAEPKLVGP